MAGGRYNLNTIEGIEKKKNSLCNKKQSLLKEIAGIEKEIEHLEKTIDGLKDAELLKLIKDSGKTMDEVKTALGL